MSEEPSGSRSLVRPYVLTKGRTKSARHLAIETLISTRICPKWHTHRFGAEYHSVRAVCSQPRSVAEIAARLRVPLGVARVLLGDMAEQGLVDVHVTTLTDKLRPDVALMERVLAGLHRL
ncbi:DUF742 domain-containing protein [Amycolatopsis suaedae]|uniref:DUF742 domain-containing protein n=1 Tax=Amycolatopsis suaedae TaxID=2510978 RepID=A0A4Q7JBH0_9PSEU|nr:DUF742 domain-containing protein [Amycolatopsis suaedae]RZQ65171.1 DUF742 domain-containing protein [Amycolatopsis suaedae]